MRGPTRAERHDGESGPPAGLCGHVFPAPPQAQAAFGAVDQRRDLRPGGGGVAVERTAAERQEESGVDFGKLSGCDRRYHGLVLRHRPGGVLNSAYRFGAGENAEIIESGTIFSSGQFIDPRDATEHLNEVGRRTLADLIINAVKERL